MSILLTFLKSAWHLIWLSCTGYYRRTERFHRWMYTNVGKINIPDSVYGPVCRAIDDVYNQKATMGHRSLTEWAVVSSSGDPTEEFSEEEEELFQNIVSVFTRYPEISLEKAVLFSEGWEDRDIFQLYFAPIFGGELIDVNFGIKKEPPRFDPWLDEDRPNYSFG